MFYRSSQVAWMNIHFSYRGHVMSFSDAIQQMLNHIDSVISALPDPAGNASNLPDDVVVLRCIRENKNGIGRVAQEDAQTPSEIVQGLFFAGIDIHLWSLKNLDLVTRSRSLIFKILNLRGQATLNGIFKHAALKHSSGPEYFRNGKLWQMALEVDLSFEFRFETVPGTGRIEQIPVNLEGELNERFIVNKS